jgi:NCAIR mutase (PurE)-related protein
MNTEEIKILLKNVKNGTLDIDSAMDKLRYLPFKDIGHTMIDSHREFRSGYPEVIYCQGKTVTQVKDIIQAMLKRDCNILATRASEEMYNEIKQLHAKAEFHSVARIISIQRKKLTIPDTYISIVSAGTSDIPVAEEAAVTAGKLGNRVEKIFDVGVAGIHRLVNKIDIVRNARAIIVVAGMEGALASVVGGLVDKPIIAVPTSIGYGANFGGVSALLGMLTSCASGVSVVNIDNGFGAGYVASMINKL